MVTISIYVIKCMLKVTLFLEYYNGPNRAYIDWFIGGEGPRNLMVNSEEQVLKHWRDTIERVSRDVAPYACDVRFFREDLEETVRQCEGAANMVDALNNFCREFHMDVNFHESYLDEKQKLKKWATYYKDYPSLKTIDYTSYKGGSILGGQSQWTFELKGPTLCLKCITGEMTQPFNCQGPEFISFAYGNVLWNERSWVWFHAQTSFIIRFDWNKDRKMFVFVPNKQNESSAKKSPRAPNPDIQYADWIVEGPKLRNVAAAGKVTSPNPVWEIQGSVPVPAALLAAMSVPILDVLKTLNLLIKQ